MAKQGLMSGKDLIAGGEVTFEQIVTILKHRLCQIYDSEYNELEIHDIINQNKGFIEDDTQIDWDKYRALVTKYKNNLKEVNEAYEASRRAQLIEIGDSISINGSSCFSVSECENMFFDYECIVKAIRSPKLIDANKYRYNFLWKSLSEKDKFMRITGLLLYSLDLSPQKRGMAPYILNFPESNNYPITQDTVKAILDELDGKTDFKNGPPNVKSYKLLSAILLKKLKNKDKSISILDLIKFAPDRYAISQDESRIKTIIEEIDQIQPRKERKTNETK